MVARRGASMWSIKGSSCPRPCPGHDGKELRRTNQLIPDFAALHPGYARCARFQSKSRMPKGEIEPARYFSRERAISMCTAIAKFAGDGVR